MATSRGPKTTKLITIVGGPAKKMDAMAGILNMISCWVCHVIWLVVSTHPKNISQNGSSSQIGVKNQRYLKPPPSCLLGVPCYEVIQETIPSFPLMPYCHGPPPQKGCRPVSSAFCRNLPGPGSESWWSGFSQLSNEKSPALLSSILVG